MATWGGLEHIFDMPLPENPTFHESISSWKHIESMKSVDDHFTQIFAQLYLKENLDQDPPESSSSSLFTLSPSSSLSSECSPNLHTSKNVNDVVENGGNPDEKKLHRRSDSVSSFNSERSSICNEGVGFESSDDVEDTIKNEKCSDDFQHEEEIYTRNHARTEYCLNRSGRNNYGAFPPPISCIGRSGKPWVSFQSIRQNGRFILTEVRIPTQEFMHACRENGRLKLHFIHSESEEEEEETGENDGDREAMED